MNCYGEIIKSVPEFLSLAGAVKKDRLPAGVTGLSHIHKAHVVASMCMCLERKALVLVPDEATATRMKRDMEVFGINALVYPARDLSFRTTESVSREYEHSRLKVLDKMLTGDYDAVVLSSEAALQLTVPPAMLMNSSLSVSAGEDYEINELVFNLIKSGYTRADQVDGAGQYAVRGGILDFFPPDSKEPCRIEFWGDTVDTISFFEAETQRRTESVEEIHITPAREVLVSDEALKALIEQLIKSHRYKAEALKSLNDDIEKINSSVRITSFDKYLPLIYPEAASIFDYAKGAMLFVCESFSVRDKMNASAQLMNETIKGLFQDGTLCKGLDRYTLTPEEAMANYSELGAVYLDNLPRGSFDTPVKELITFTAKQIAPWNGSVQAIVDDIDSIRGRKGQTCAVLAGTDKAANNLVEDLKAEDIPAIWCPVPPKEFPKGLVCVLSGSFSAGFEYPSVGFTVISYRGKPAPKAKSAVKKSAKHAFNNLNELHRGEYVVHDTHGIGIFEGIQSLENAGTTKDYIKIQYDKGDNLYVPVTQLDQVSKYIGPRSDDKPLKLSRLGGKDWQKTRAKVKSAVKDMAKELIELYSKRLKVNGHAFSEDIDMQSDFERRFEFVETDDQLRCIHEIKRDMEKPYPMDRLLCGDVGFGKTEVALRAVFKCVADGKQVAIMVPTTILALQHYQTIMKRFEGFPIEAGMLSRFCTKKEIDRTLNGLRRGSVDVVVGTHRIISKDVQFRDLGLIIIDEEQRFGVAQKEKLKSLFPAVDVLTLTATPIPRTLNMAMSGIRDMSVIEEAPMDRLPVQTYVIEHDMGVLVQAMEQELRRGGQVYYLYNKVESIEKKAAQIKAMIPEATVAVGHGKMSEDELSEVWRRLLEGEIDILVCTTIIETGVDVPNVNTLIIENADRMGLAQLHQIRGRVGRSSRRASAYFTFTRGKELSEIATRRLDAIREFTEFGSGFHIAMRDLELRGAGNVLGANQHGHMESVGYEMYITLLEQAIAEEKGETPKSEEKDCLVDLPIDAHIPDNYIESVPQRLQIYRRIADIKTDDDASDVIDELVDRFGDPPASVEGLIRIALVRGMASRHNIFEISSQGDRVIFKISALNMNEIAAASEHFKGRMTVSPGNGQPHIAVRTLKGENKLSLIERVLEYMDETAETKNAE
ncbi:MAG: transcription-repair coupling factor [Clostridia bacterium]|nr:transcription-repair coupling factor [Clostridia bacterium]